MSKKPEQPSSQSDELFRQAMQGVTPLAPADRIQAVLTPAVNRGVTRHTASQKSSFADPFSDHGASEVPPVSFLRPGLNSITLRRLRRGQWPVQDSYDLHGYTLEQARAELYRFLKQAVANQFRCINVIHGKGWQSGGKEGVLKIHVRHWLQQFPEVLAFCEPPVNAGGGGAVWVLLKSSAT